MYRIKGGQQHSLSSSVLHGKVSLGLSCSYLILPMFTTKFMSQKLFLILIFLFLLVF